MGEKTSKSQSFISTAFLKLLQYYLELERENIENKRMRFNSYKGFLRYNLVKLYYIFSWCCVIDSNGGITLCGNRRRQVPIARENAQVLNNQNPLSGEEPSLPQSFLRRYPFY